MNDKIKTVIIDNDPSAISKLSDDLKSFPDIKVLDTATSIKKARSIIIALQPDLLFLGIEMPGMSGLDLLQEIRPEIHSGMRTIFCAAHDKYFRHVMLASDFDYYLLKPYRSEERRVG
jgi:two-component system LytT family response regulator